MRACELSSVLHLPVHVQSGSAATRVRQRSQRDVQGVRLRSHDVDVLHLLPSGLGARQRDPVMDLPYPSPRKPRPSRSQQQHLLLPPLWTQLESLKQRRLIQVQLDCLQ